MEEMIQVNQSVPTSLVIWIVIIVIIEFVLKGMALYRAGQNSSKGWFITLLIFNTAGILPLIYLLTHKKSE